VQTGFRDGLGRWQAASAAAVAAILDALGAEAATPPAGNASLIVHPGLRRRLPETAQVVLEDGTELAASRELPADLPPGYHRLRTAGGERQLIVSPGRCFLPAGLRTHGWAVQLYALRSRSSWGLGDLGDLGDLCRWSSAELGAGVVLVNPLHATVPTTPQQASPYFPSSRRFRNPLYLRVEDVPGASGLGEELGSLASAGRQLNRERLIDRDAVFRLKMAALRRIWERRPAAERRVDEGDAELVDFATHCALVEEQGPAWRQWPAHYRDPRSPEVARFRQERQDLVAFHAWLQGLLDAQLTAASRHLTVMQDLAIGVDPEGADAWCWQDVLATGVSTGAPPDEFNTRGQDWGFRPFDPWRLRAAGYAPFIATIRAALRGGGALRIDHVMGLFRLYWIPEGTRPDHGAYVGYPASDLLDILALESHRAGAFVCGEDLGTVEPRVRRELKGRDVLAYRLLWFEQERPPTWPEHAVAAVTTHDLPTVAGLWSGEDLAVQSRIGLNPNAEAAQAIRARIVALTGLDEDATVEEVIAAVHAALAEAPSAVLLATLDDALAVAERPNVPGTVDEWPNWRLALPASLEEIKEDPRVRRVAEALRRRRPDVSDAENAARPRPVDEAPG
jgi:4-alpha-glucanotransferase